MTAVAAITCLQIDVSFLADIADLRLRPSLSYRGIPLLTVVNGTIIMAVWRSSRTPLSCACQARTASRVLTLTGNDRRFHRSGLDVARARALRHHG